MKGEFREKVKGRDPKHISHVNHGVKFLKMLSHESLVTESQAIVDVEYT